MTGITHRLAGTAAGMALIRGLQTENPGVQAVLLGGCILGSLIPDIDNPRSTISHRAPFIRFITGALQGAIRLLSVLLPGKMKRYVRSCIGHRGISHSLFMAVMLPAAIMAMGELLHLKLDLFALGMAVGILSHIVLDLFSGGTALFLPVSSKVIKIMKIHTGGAAEWGVRLLLTALLAGQIFYG